MVADPAHRVFVSYIDRTRDYYGALGYTNPYRWAYDTTAPALHVPAGPFAGLRVGVVVTSYPPLSAGEPTQATQPYTLAVDAGGPDGTTTAPEVPPAAEDTAAAGRRDTAAAHAALAAAVAAGRIGSMSPRFYSLPTEYSQRRTVEQDAPQIAAWMRQDGVDAAILLPYRPVCHQTLALLARHLDAAGIASVLVGSARDIVEQAGVGRFLFVDVALGHPLGEPARPDEATTIAAEALDLLERAWAPRTTVQSAVRWSEDGWRDQYMAVDAAKRAELAAAGRARRVDQQLAKTDGRARTT